MELKNFQLLAAQEIADKYAHYIQEPLPNLHNTIVPFYQNLSAVTGSGKTLVLIEALEQIRAVSSAQPIVLWLSKGRVVVDQTYKNMTSGKYQEYLPNYVVKPLLDCRNDDIEYDSNKGLLLMATVGKINQKDKKDGDRIVYRTGFDNADRSLWDRLKIRRTHEGVKRELIVVYDEGHNLSDQQTQLLLDLNPEALISASATTKVPKRLEWTITRLKKDKNLTDKDLLTLVSNRAVVQGGLIKKHIALSGYLTPMEVAIDNLLDDMQRTEQAARQYGCSFLPKAIYVSDTNVLRRTSEMDNPQVDFKDRQARPIQIWRYLVKQGIPPDEIAVYCNLKFDRNHPKPAEFHLFSGGDSDYEQFTAGNYRHIIFNQSLQEGWDDPCCYFAYIDKSMGSATQVTQIIGRVLRQPEATHYPDAKLNMANFYIRTDEHDVFRSILDEVRHTLAIDLPDISIHYREEKQRGSRPTVPPKVQVNLPDIIVDSTRAKPGIAEVIRTMMDYRDDTINTVGRGETLRYVADIGSNAEGQLVTGQTKHSNRVTARWVFRKQLETLAKQAVTLCDMSDPKFDAMIEYTSNAAVHVRDKAKAIADIYRRDSIIKQNTLDTTAVGDVFITDRNYTFENGVHARYSDFNNFELPFARELDTRGVLWMRNPQNGLLRINLLDGKETDTFNPDFIVWQADKLLALDTKGNHLLQTDLERKLFAIDKIGDGPDLAVKFISPHKYNERRQITDDAGFTVWQMEQGLVTPVTCDTMEQAVTICIDAY